MLKVTHNQIRKELSAAEAFRVSDVYGAATVLGEMIFFTLGIFLLLRTPLSSPLYWVLEILLALSIFRASAIVHECAHSSIFNLEVLNPIAGLLFSPICLIPYTPYKHVHMQHHKWVGVIDKDPTQVGVLKMAKLSGIKKRLLGLIWRSWIPLPFMTYVFNTYWAYVAREFRKGRRANGWKALGSMTVTLLPHVAGITLLGVTKYLALYGPMFLLFYLQFENMYIPQHSRLFPYVSQLRAKPIPFYEQDSITRSTYIPPYLSIVLGYHHNLHTEHHLFPTVPWYRLPLVKRKLEAVKDNSYQEVEFLTFMKEAREHNPVDSYATSIPVPRGVAVEG
jgi:omega-6 fatty acid desaturase (delta-12 desaturase)